MKRLNPPYAFGALFLVMTACAGADEGAEPDAHAPPSTEVEVDDAGSDAAAASLAPLEAIPGVQVIMALEGDLNTQDTFYDHPWPSDFRTPRSPPAGRCCRDVHVCWLFLPVGSKWRLFGMVPEGRSLPINVVSVVASALQKCCVS